MNVETLPAAGAGAAAEAQWVEGELVRALMLAQQRTRWVAPLLVLLFLGLLWGQEPLAGLVAWTAAGGTLAALRACVVGSYVRQVASRGSREHLLFFRRWRWLWPASALAWALSTLLFLDRASLQDQFMGWLILAATAMFAVNILSPHLQTVRAYLDVLMATALAGICWRMVGDDLALRPTDYHVWMLLLILPFWHLLRRTGDSLHQTHRRNFELQFRNRQLIESLTRQTQAALEAVEIKNRFLASAAHDIRQPVHALGLYADWLRSEPELVSEIAPKIVQSTQAVNQLFDALFDLARLESGRIRLHVQEVDVAALLREVELQFRPLAQAKGLQLRLRLRARPAQVQTDPILLKRVICNLLSNAIKYTRHGGVLLAVRGAAGRPCRVEIWDTGIGIPDMHQREIFREFYKVPGHAGTEEGFGLGLYIVGRLTRILGHPLAFRSVAGCGSMFRMVLQPTDAVAAAERASVTQLARRP